MAENVNALDIFGSGGHVWTWGRRQNTGKTLGSAGISGAASILIALGPRPVRIEGRNGGPALLTASGASRAAADTAMNVLETAIEGLIEAGTMCAWEDDRGGTGTAMVVKAFNPGRRTYSTVGATVRCWLNYTCDMVELSGGK